MKNQPNSRRLTFLAVAGAFVVGGMVAVSHTDDGAHWGAPAHASHVNGTHTHGAPTAGTGTTDGVYWD